MHEQSHAHRSSFKSKVADIDAYLKEKFPDRLRTLSSRELKKYTEHSFVRGWTISDADSGIVFKVLIPEQFPYGVPRIAIADIANPDRNFSLEWPHVEGEGLLCLPALAISMTEPVRVLNDLLHHAFQFVAEFVGDPEKAKKDFRREFISYWNRQKTTGTPILSLTDLSGDTRQIYFAEGKDPGWLMADKPEDLQRWHDNKHGSKIDVLGCGLFIKLQEAPVPPYPETPAEFDAFIAANAPTVHDSFRRNILHPGPYLIILSAPSESGTGLIAISLLKNSNSKNPLRGFRGTATMPMNIRLDRLSESHDLRRHAVVRVDHDWIHGRGFDPAQAALKKASVVILGCGALGSHVAVRLAQSGVGALYLVDHEQLETANVGRHVLGTSHVPMYKASALTRELSRRFPHIQVYGYTKRWEDAFAEYPKHFESPSLIISAMATWAGEGPLNEWHVSKSQTPPILYGWVEPRAAAAHALLIRESGACLQCVLDDTGKPRVAETEGWKDEHGTLSEPACGSIFQPFGPIELANAESLVADLAVEALVGSKKGNKHMVHAVSSERLDALQGKWTVDHRKFRPNNFAGSFQYERPVAVHAECPHCSKK